MKNKEEASDEDLNQEINEKLDQLWTGMDKKRKNLVKSMTPHYSRRTDNISQINQSSMNMVSENQILKTRQKFANEISSNKRKDVEIESLKNKITELDNDKKMLIYELKKFNLNLQSNKIQSSLLNESSIQNSGVSANQNTASFEDKLTLQNKLCRQIPHKKKYSTISEEPSETHPLKQERKANQLEHLSKNQIIELLKSTSQYRGFTDYFNSHKLSYLHTLEGRNQKNYMKKDKQMIDQIQLLNEQEKMKLSLDQIDQLCFIMERYYEQHYYQTIRKNKEMLGIKVKKLEKEMKNLIPQEVCQKAKVKEKLLTKISEKGTRKKRTNTFK